MGEPKKELVGVDTDFDVKFSNGKAVLKVNAKHVGSDVEVDSSNEIRIDAKKFLNSAIDKLEEIIPGDQKKWAEMAKAALENVEL